MLGRFTTARGEGYKPACFLIRANIPIAERDGETIRAFRNVCAISTTTAAYAVGLDSPHAAQWMTHWSDQFFFGYFVAGKNGWVQTLDGASKGADDKIPHQQSAAAIRKTVPTGRSFWTRRSSSDSLHAGDGATYTRGTVESSVACFDLWRSRFTPACFLQMASLA